MCHWNVLRKADLRCGKTVTNRKKCMVLNLKLYKVRSHKSLRLQSRISKRTHTGMQQCEGTMTHKAHFWTCTNRKEKRHQGVRPPPDFCSKLYTNPSWLQFGRSDPTGARWQGSDWQWDTARETEPTQKAETKSPSSYDFGEIVDCYLQGTCYLQETILTEV